MTNDELITILQQDLENERMHCLFYQQAAAMVKGLHREEYRELFLKEAESELHHVDEFATLIVQLGGVPKDKVAEMPTISSDPQFLCLLAHRIEKKVADNYAERLKQTDNGATTETVYVNLFYEDQLMDSQKGALEFKLLAGGQ